LQLLDQKAPRAPTGSGCNISEIKKNWQRVANSVDAQLGVSFVEGDRAAGAPWFQLTSNFDPKAKLDTFQDLFSPEQSDLGALIGLENRHAEIQQQKKDNKALLLQACPETYDKYAKIADQYVSVTCQELQRLGDKTEGDSAEKKVKIEVGDWKGLANAAKQIFKNSLISKKLRRPLGQSRYLNLNHAQKRSKQPSLFATTSWRLSNPSKSVWLILTRVLNSIVVENQDAGKNQNDPFKVFQTI